jgi:ubiquinone/menaquinone biosynthesis C-methylase UbiE
MVTQSGKARSAPTSIIDCSSARELTRQLEMEGALAAQDGAGYTDVEGLRAIRDVLDVACGPGGWALEVAACHSRTCVTGIDISPTMIGFARARAEVRRLGNARFAVMDATAPLDFLDGSFDLVNARGLSGFMLTQHWAPLLLECRRILRPGGVLRLGEYEVGASSSPAHGELMEWFLRAMARTGRSFAEGPGLLRLGITLKLRPLLQEAGFQDIQTASSHLDYSSGCPLHEPWTHSLLTLADLARPFLVESGVAGPGQVQRVVQELAVQMQSAQFAAFLTSSSAWGRKPAREGECSQEAPERGRAGARRATALLQR